LAADAHREANGAPVSWRRPPIVAIQAIIVGVLAVVVYATLLKPDDSGQLSGITTPAGQAPAAQPGPGAYIPRTGPRRKPPRGPGPGNGRAPAVGAGLSIPAPSAVGAEPSPAGIEMNGDEGDHGSGSDEGSPTDEQYADTLTRITAPLY